MGVPRRSRRPVCMGVRGGDDMIVVAKRWGEHLNLNSPYLRTPAGDGVLPRTGLGLSVADRVGDGDLDPFEVDPVPGRAADGADWFDRRFGRYGWKRSLCLLPSRGPSRRLRPGDAPRSSCIVISLSSSLGGVRTSGVASALCAATLRQCGRGVQMEAQGGAGLPPRRAHRAAGGRSRG